MRFGQVGNIAGDFFRAQLGVACDHAQFFDVNRGVAVIGHNFFGDQNRVLEVVTIPRHERDHHVLTQRQFAQVGRCTVSDHVAARHDVAFFDDRTLVDVGVLVRAGVFDQVVDVYTDFTGHGFVVVHANHNAVRFDVINHAATQRLYRCTRVNRHGALNPRTDNRFFSTQTRNGLTLHV